jgi:hypothetical protein
MESLRKMQEPSGDRTRDQIMGANTGMENEGLLRAVRGVQAGGAQAGGIQTSGGLG